MKVDGMPCPYCDKRTFSTTHLNEDGESFVECYKEEGGCGRPYVVYIPKPILQTRKLTEQERDGIKYYYSWYKTLNMEE